MNINHLCMNCMKEKINDSGKCIYCGFEEATTPNKPNQLELWTVLRGTYLVGTALGEGGFGITYVGMDLNLQIKVAIKEFFPFGFAVRRGVGDSMVCRYEGEKGEFFLREKAKFVEEARILAQLDEQPGVVKVRDYFEENGTAYIVMEFLEGETLKDHISQNGGRVSVKEVLSLMKPVIKSLAGIHEKNVIHRDISPDNIMLTANGKVKLIDFGAAKRSSGADSTVLYKKGFSPLEQMSGEEEGTYSDIYALCATMYYTITGKIPVSPALRAKEDSLQTPSSMGIEIEPLVEAAIMYGLEIKPENRIKNAGDLYYFLYVYGNNENASPKDMQRKIRQSSTQVIVENIKKENRMRKQRMTVLIVAVVVLVLGLAFLTIKHYAGKGQNNKTPVVTDIVEAKEETQEITSEMLDELRLQFYEEVNAYRASKGYASANTYAEYEKMAGEYIAECITSGYASTEEWNSALIQFADEIITGHDAQGVGWLVLPYTTEHSVEQVIVDAENNINANNAGKEDSSNLMTCTDIGIGIGVHSDGTYFWAIFYR